MDPLIFIEGLQLGLLITGAVHVRYLHRERSADVSPQLRRIQLQLDNLETATNLALVTRYAEISANTGPAPGSLGSPEGGGLR